MRRRTHHHQTAIRRSASAAGRPKRVLDSTPPRCRLVVRAKVATELIRQNFSTEPRSAWLGSPRARSAASRDRSYAEDLCDEGLELRGKALQYVAHAFLHPPLFLAQGFADLASEFSTAGQAANSPTLAIRRGVRRSAGERQAWAVTSSTLEAHRSVGHPERVPEVGVPVRGLALSPGWPGPYARRHRSERRPATGDPASFCRAIPVSSSSSRNAPLTSPVSSGSRWPPGSSHVHTTLWRIISTRPRSSITAAPQVTCPGSTARDDRLLSSFSRAISSGPSSARSPGWRVEVAAIGHGDLLAGDGHGAPLKRMSAGISCRPGRGAGWTFPLTIGLPGMPVELGPDVTDHVT